jgi:hypothetical protein
MRTRALSTTLCLAAILLAQGTVKAVLTEHDIIFTEFSPTSLTVAFDGQPQSVFNFVDDSWGILTVGIAGLPAANWAEPENSPENTFLVNQVVFISDTICVLNSDVFVFSGAAAVANGTRISFGTAVADNLPVFATFHDNASTAEGHSVPDGASTATLLGVALIGICFLGRKISRNHPVTLAG